MRLDSRLGAMCLLAFLSACAGRSSEQTGPRETGDAGSGGRGSPSGGSGGSGTGGGGGTAIPGRGGSAGSIAIGGTDTGGMPCSDRRISQQAFCLGGFDCPLALDDLKQVERLCQRDAEDGYYFECSGGFTRLEWLVGFGENSYDLVFSTATGELVYGDANVYDLSCSSIRTTAGTFPNLGTCESCGFCASVIDESLAGAGGEAGAGPDHRCTFDADGRVRLP
jgi:hypothetical protein